MSSRLTRDKHMGKSSISTNTHSWVEPSGKNPPDEGFVHAAGSYIVEKYTDHGWIVTSWEAGHSFKNVEFLILKQEWSAHWCDIVDPQQNEIPLIKVRTDEERDNRPMLVGKSSNNKIGTIIVDDAKFKFFVYENECPTENQLKDREYSMLYLEESTKK